MRKTMNCVVLILLFLMMAFMSPFSFSYAEIRMHDQTPAKAADFSLGDAACFYTVPNPSSELKELYEKHGNEKLSRIPMIFLGRPGMFSIYSAEQFYIRIFISVSLAVFLMIIRYMYSSDGKKRRDILSILHSKHRRT